MPREPTLNEQKGKQISDLEALMILMDKLIYDKIEQKPKAGIILAKGKPNERRYRFTEAKKTLQVLRDYFGMKGCFSLGVCDTCKSFSRDSHASLSGAFGTCAKNRCTYHCWDTCSNHSKQGGGYGV